MSSRPDELSVTDAAARVGIAGATWRNWFRLGLLPDPVRQKPLRFSPAAVEIVRQQLAGGSLTKLRSRTNRSRQTGGPADRSLRLLVNAFYQLKRRGECANRPLSAVQLQDFRRNVIGGIVLAWRQSCAPLPPVLPGVTVTRDQRLLGSELPRLSGGSERSGNGSYYTPEAMAASLAGNLPEKGSVLDPACGVGTLLLAAARRGRVWEELYGIDRDPDAVRLAALNLLLFFPDEQRLPQLETGDLLTRKNFFHGRKFDSIIANPPWGRAQKRDLTGGGPATRETGWQMLAAAAPHLRPGGTLHFLLPQSFEEVRIHRAAAVWCRQKFGLQKISRLKQKVPGVLSGVMQTWWQPGRPPGADFGELGRRVWQPWYDRPHTTLKELGAVWGIGVVTGDNGKRLHELGSRPGLLPVTRGCEITPFEIAPSHWGVDPGEPLQQLAPMERYRYAPKMVYRFIAASPVLAVDTRGRITLNSANFFYLPSAGPYTLDAIAALWHSSAWQRAYQASFGGRKILRNDLENLPLPLFDAAVLVRLDELGRRGTREGAAAVRQTIDALLAPWLPPGEPWAAPPDVPRSLRRG